MLWLESGTLLFYNKILTQNIKFGVILFIRLHNLRILSD